MQGLGERDRVRRWLIVLCLFGKTTSAVSTEKKDLRRTQSGPVGVVTVALLQYNLSAQSFPLKKWTRIPNLNDASLYKEKAENNG
jgi:hypothetical protein